MNFRDVEMLSAYLDGELSPSDASRLELRLSSEPSLRGVLDDLRLARGLLRQLPTRRAPRNFTLRPTMSRLAAPEPRVFPAFRLASVLASLLFLASLAVNGLAPIAVRNLAVAAAPVIGKGGGFGGGPAASGSAPAEAPSAEAPSAEAPQAAAPIQPFATIAGTPTLEALASPAPLDLGAASAKSAPPAPGAQAPQSAAPVPVLWELILVAAALVFGITAWYLRYLSRRNFRSRYLEK